MKLTVKQNTIFKQYAIDSSKLTAADKVEVVMGQSFELHSWKPAGKFHWKVAIVDQAIGNPARNTWYVFSPHVQFSNSKGQAPIPPSEPKPVLVPSRFPDSKRLNVPYFDQLNNSENPRGACNVTCFAMVMNYFKIQKRTSALQFEDELYRYMENQGLSRHEPEDLSIMGKTYGLANDLTLRGSLYDMKKSIAEGKPCIIHGYFTSFGHIITVIGYDKNGFIVNDPFGEWTADGYIEGPYGGALHYSNQLIQSKCSPEGSNYMWLHRLSKI